MKQQQYTRMIIEAGVMIGLAYALNLLTIFKMPQGGSVTAGSMIPILIFAYRWGLKPGLLAGMVFGLMQLFLGGYMATPVQAALDYPIAFGLLGLAGLFANKQEISFLNAFSGIGLALIARTVAHVISGVVFFAEYTPEGWNTFVYSLVYNGSYMGVEALISLVVLFSLAKSLKNQIALQY